MTYAELAKSLRSGTLADTAGILATATGARVITGGGKSRSDADRSVLLMEVARHLLMQAAVSKQEAITLTVDGKGKRISGARSHNTADQFTAVIAAANAKRLATFAE